MVFSLPGAFTPTCSSTHLPRYEALYDEIKAQGVDEIICLSVNDAFVMYQWGQHQKAEKVFLLPDGNGEFTRKMGMLVDKSNLGFGMRTWRYSMVVNDGNIEKLFAEPGYEDNCPTDPFEVSDADTMLEFLAPGAEKPLDVTVFSRGGCPHCVNQVFGDVLGRVGGPRFTEHVHCSEFQSYLRMGPVP